MKPPQILVTRAQPGADQTAERLSGLGYDPILSPAIDLRPVKPAPKIDMAGVQGLIFTSANGVLFFAKECTDRTARAWCVGPATLEAAQLEGFRDAVSAHGNSDDLLALIAANADPSAGKLVHIANTAAAGTLVTGLAALGFRATFIGLYSPRQAEAFSEPARHALTRKRVQAVLFHSEKGAAAFARHAIAMDLSETVAVSVSEKAAGPVSHLTWKSSQIAAAPNETALINALLAVIPPV